MVTFLVRSLACGASEPCTLSLSRLYVLPVKILIYGATKGRGDGIGRSAAVALLARGHAVRGLCRNRAKAASEDAFPVEAIDLLGSSGQDRLKSIIRGFDPDVIWSACGTGFPGPLWELTDGEVAETVEANVTNNAIFCRTCAPSCLDGGSHLLLTGSVAGSLEGEGAALYAGVKGFLLPFIRGQRAEYRRQGHNPKLSLLLLGPVRTTGIELVVDALEFVGRQSRSLEILVA